MRFADLLGIATIYKIDTSVHFLNMGYISSSQFTPSIWDIHKVLNK